MRFWAAGNFHSARAELRDHLVKIVDPVVDHKRGVAGAEPLARLLCDIPNGEPLVFGGVIRPSQDSAAPAFQRYA